MTNVERAQAVVARTLETEVQMARHGDGTRTGTTTTRAAELAAELTALIRAVVKDEMGRLPEYSVSELDADLR